MERGAGWHRISGQRPSKNPVCRLSENFLNTACDTIGCLFWFTCWLLHKFRTQTEPPRPRTVGGDVTGNK